MGGLILVLFGIGWDSLAGYTFARVSQNLGECRPSPAFQICRTPIQIVTVLHCLTNYFLTIPASTGHSLCKTSAAAAAAAVYGVGALGAKQTILLMAFLKWRQLRRDFHQEVLTIESIREHTYIYERISLTFFMKKFILWSKGGQDRDRNELGRRFGQ